ncbi:DNA primase [Falsirhodobacter sp. 20TX0035]|uniref:DNA primase n=1 Tax=Falsirhodobacter sp. 20TX0035 TaxID=3022019 RepID=UPI00232BF016|nr:DNA primase [Falsirhodobacter sp. 20TX0035]MDB6453444.1 DNA primase [Falsirhodobacter sp. 20TX0035]
MSLPNGFLDELRTRISLSQVVGRKVTWDVRKSNQGKGDWWAPCPFHQEKSASFHVDDRKGFYYCFGCHAKGDALTFVKETENVSFMEAVEILAREAGLPMPARDPRAAEKTDHRAQLAQVVEEAVKHYRLMLKSGQGVAARDYLSGRRLSVEAQERWEIGFAPDHRQGLFQALTAKGISADLLVASGVCARPDDGGAPYDRFRGRIIFPIRDARGRAISLGGRAMDPNARAKYLNGPETDLFDKGRNLYNHGPAREAAGKGRLLIVAEGYMDTIALSEAGFTATVAPLGTAITEDQLRLMWRIADEPVIALDGDAAGIRAALRVVDLALPLLEAGKGLRFAVLPSGLDPDDLIRTQGAPGFQKVLDGAEPMAGLLWRRETEGKVFDSPERRAGLDKVLGAAIARIADPSIRHHYTEEMKRLKWQLFGARSRQTPFVPGKRPQAPAVPTSSTRQSLLAMVEDEAMALDLRTAVLLAGFATHPSLIPAFETAIERMVVRQPEHRRLQEALLAHDLGSVEADLETLLALPHVRISPPVRNPEDIDLARMCLAEEFAKLDAAHGVEIEIREAMEDMEGLADEGLTWRLQQAAEARNNAGRTRLDDAGDLGEDRSALSRHLQDLIDGQIWVKKKG